MGPAEPGHDSLAVFEIAEMQDCSLECFDAVHESIMRLFGWYAKYIIALIWPGVTQSDPFLVIH